ncbi:uncharacterized protein LOC110850228 [Folsomia candida]|uniref:Lysosomal-associated transmembrane protein 4B n=1 Tax=Folsomia candida TaxID=158441 RepID=A0A226E7I8_FOLCA|nr:uncharacterized protein LOC110850228 [Folsomia candida]OXA53575.1 hypothetical protein Fcan01_10723 [Folsomia candida]
MIKNSEKMSRTCCFGCCTVGHGTLTIGILHIICAILSMILNSIVIYFMINCPNQIIRQDPRRYITFSCIQIFMAIVYLILACLMVDGYRMRKHRFIMPWLVWNYVSLCLGAAATVILFLLMVVAGQVGAGFIVLAICGVYLAVQTYFVYVVKTFVDGLKGSLIY